MTNAKNRVSRLVLVAVVALVSVGCGGANMAYRDGAGGLVELQGAYMPAMGEARVKMAEHCGGRFDYEERGETVAFRCKQPRGLVVAHNERTRALAAR